MSLTLLSLLSSSAFAGGYTEALQIYCSKDHGSSSFTVSVGNAIPIYNRQYPLSYVVGDSIEQPIDNVFIKTLEYTGLTSECAEYLIKHGNITTEKTSADAIVGRVFFGFDQASLSKESKHVLDEVIKTLKSSESSLKLEGNTDSTGSIEYNLALGLKRASGVDSYVVDNGISPSRTDVLSNGESAPIADNKTPKGRAQNRRVDIVVN